MKVRLPSSIVFACLFLLSVSSARAADPIDADPKPGTPLATGELTSDIIFYEFGIYYLPNPTKDPSAELDRLLAKEFAEFHRDEDFDDEAIRPIIVPRYEKNVAEDYAPPSLEALQYFGRGLNREQAVALQDCREAYVLEFGYSKKHVLGKLKLALRLAEALARETGGLLWDETTREVFSADEWKKRRIDRWTEDVPDVLTLTTVYAYQNDGLVRGVTSGMQKLGLPDVVVNGFPWSHNRAVNSTINLLNQSWVEGQTLKKAGEFDLDVRSIKNKAVRESTLASFKKNATGVARLTLKHPKREEGDGMNRLVAIEFDRAEGPDAQARQVKILSELFGAEDEIAYIKHDEALKAASERARTKLPMLRAEFQKGLPPGEHILLKAPFKTPAGGNEYMWVEVSHWEGDKIRGLLQSDPAHVPDLKAGQNVEISEATVFDYIVRGENGKFEGNETSEIILKMRKVREMD